MAHEPGTRAIALPDGARLLVRPIEPEDRARLVAGFERLSPESRYRRFFTPLGELSGRQLDYLTRVDHHDHEALVAIDEQSGEGVAVARFIRVGEGVAEPAIAVVDDWQNRGVGSALLDLLVERAREEGIRRFAALVLADNPGAITILERLGDTRRDPRGREIELDIDLTEPAEAVGSIRSLLGAIAAGGIQPALTLWHRVAARRGARAGVLRNVVVVGLDPDGADGAGLPLATAIARASGATLHLVAARRLLLDDHDEVDERVAQIAARLAADLEAPVRSHVRRSEQATALLDVAVEEHARLIVVEDTGAPDTSDRLVGSAWRHVAHHAPCDVLVARARG